MIYRSLFSILLILWAAGCASLPLDKARSAFYQGNLGEADRALENCNDISSKNRLLCHMEKGMVLHYAGNYEKSTDILLEASRLMEAKDQISVAEQTSAMLINDRTTTYKGEYAEQLWVHTYLMMNFMLRHRHESALVEAKQALEVYRRYPGSLKEDHYTRALIALSFENMNLPDDARIEYEKLAAQMGGGSTPPAPISEGRGELVLFIGQGRAPRKISADVVVPPSVRISLPQYADYRSAAPLSILCDGHPTTVVEISTDLGQVLRKSLNDRSAAFLARQAVRAGAKEAIARGIGKNSEAGEALARIIFFLIEEADTRSWETLPGHLKLVRIELEAGTHDLEISAGYLEKLHIGSIDIPEGRRVYRSIRF